MTNLMQAKVQKIDEICAQTPVMPVIAVDVLENAVPLAKALVAGGIKVLEVTLRTECAVDAIKAMIREVPEAIVGAGTIANIEQLKAVQDAGAAFAISPGITYQLLEQAKTLDIPFLPGIATASELMTGLEIGYSRFKLFPAAVAGGQGALKSFGGPFPQVRFCPTGGIKESDFTEYLQLDNVMCVGGTWLVPAEALQNKDWDTITAIAAKAVQLAKASN